MAEPVIISATKQGGVENAYVGTIVRMGRNGLETSFSR